MEEILYGCCDLNIWTYVGQERKVLSNLVGCDKNRLNFYLLFSCMYLIKKDTDFYLRILWLARTV